ncbi:LCP family protein [uncultured Robinsoniella sp.]|uniref:LCP family glycopolymer transferase n=1 Tax=uncultured Robinsoniella sp. TaxID=904190 RepID=UPI00374FC417
MNTLIKVGKVLETISVELEKVSISFIISVFVAELVLILIFIVISYINISDHTKKIIKNIAVNSMLLLYLGVILTITLFTRTPGMEAKVQLIPFDEIFQAGSLNRAIVREFCNILLFIPIGIFICMMHYNKKKKTFILLLIPVCSLFIETVQLITRSGVFDIDDLICNIAGGFLGLGICMLFRYAFSKGKKRKIVYRILLSCVTICILMSTGAFGVYHTYRVMGKSSILYDYTHIKVPTLEKNSVEETEDYDPSLYYYAGKAYRYNENIINILCIGIDKRTDEIETIDGVSGKGGQADAIFLVSLNPDTKKMKIFGISRDTMTQIKNYDYKGNYVGEDTNHLALAYAYGDGSKTSCEMMREAVSKLMYNLPIHGYAAINLEAISKLNDAVGGVTVTIPEDMTYDDPAFQEGARITLTGEQSMIFIQRRDITKSGGNGLRMQRQKSYVLSFLNTSREAIKKNPTLPIELYHELSKNMVTNLGLDNAVYLATLMLSTNFSDSDIQMLPGSTKKGVYYEEFHIDQDALYELLLHNFYTEVYTSSDGGDLK